MSPVPVPIPMRLRCEGCGALHIDVGEFATKPHHTHTCQECGLSWRPAIVHTVGVRFLPGYKNENVEDENERLLKIAKGVVERNDETIVEVLRSLSEERRQRIVREIV